MALRDDGGDVDHRRTCGPEQFDGRFFVGGEIAARCDEARLGGDLSAVEDFAIREEAREQAEDHHERDEQLGCAGRLWRGWARWEGVVKLVRRERLVGHGH